MKKLLAIPLFCLLAGGLAQAQAPSIQGAWRVRAVLTTTSVPNAYVREGHMKEETWTIRQQGDLATLTTPNGSINGRFFPATPEFPGGVWKFQLMVPNFMNQPNLGARFEVVIVKRSPNMLSGGTTVTYLGNNMMGGPWVPMGMESWRFDAYRAG